MRLPRVLITIPAILCLLFYPSSEVLSKSKKTATPDKESLDFIKNISVVKKIVDESLALLKAGGESGAKAKTNADEIIKHFTTGRNLKLAMKNEELNLKVNNFNENYHSFLNGFETAQKSFQEFKKKYDKLRNYYLENRKDNKFIAKKIQDMKLLQGKAVKFKKGIDEDRKKISALKDKESKIRTICRQQGISYSSQSQGRNSHQ